MATHLTPALLGLTLTNPWACPPATRTPHRSHGHHMPAWHGRQERPKVRGPLQLARSTTPCPGGDVPQGRRRRAGLSGDSLQEGGGSETPHWRPAGFLVEAAGHMRRAPRSPELSRRGHPAPECVRRGVRCVYFPPAAEAPQELTD